MSIRLVETYQCCGAYLICNFDYEDFGTPSAPEISDIKEEIKDKLLSLRKRAFAYVFLNPNQKRCFDKLLKELKFRPVAVGYNKPHKTDITMYVYTNKRPIEGD